jgi:hypothetical protein
MVPEVQQQGVFVLVIFLVVLAERGWQWLRRRAARAWPVAEGRVQSAEWRQPRTGTNRYFLADLAFSYVVGGRFYAGYYRRSFSRREEAIAWTESMRGRTLQIRYRALRPARCLFREEDQREATLARELVPEAAVGSK